MLRAAAAAGLLLFITGCAEREAVKPAGPDGHAEYLPAVTATPLVRTATTAAGQPIVFPAPVEMVALDVTIPAGAETGWHRHPHPGFAYVLSGDLVVDAADGSSHRYRAGDAFTEVVGLAHNGRAVGTAAVRLIVWFSAAPGAPVTVKEPDGFRPIPATPSPR